MAPLRHWFETEHLTDGSQVALSPSGQNPLIKAIIEHFRPAPPRRHSPLHRRHRTKFVNLETVGVAALGVTLDSAAKTPDVIVHHTAKNWLLFIEAVTSAGPVDGKRRAEIKDLFVGCKAGLVFVPAFENCHTIQAFVSHIASEFEVWIAEAPGLIHFDGERILGPYPDMMPKHS